MDELKEKELEPIEEKPEIPGSSLKSALVLQGLGLKGISAVNLTKHISVALQSSTGFNATDSGVYAEIGGVEAELLHNAKVFFLPVQNGTPTSEDPITVTGWSAVNLYESEENLIPAGLKLADMRNVTLQTSPMQSASSYHTFAVPIPKNCTKIVWQKKVGNTDGGYLALCNSYPAVGVACSDISITTNKDYVEFTNPGSKYLAVSIYKPSSNTDEKLTSYIASREISIHLRAGRYYTKPGEFLTFTADLSDLDDTVFGGSVDFATGEVVSEWAEIASYAGEEIPGEYYSSVDGHKTSGTPTTGAQVVYKLEEPVVYQIDPQEINLFVGVTEIYSDAGDVEIIY